MIKDITKKFLENKNKYSKKMVSRDARDISMFEFKNDLNVASKQIMYDEIEFHNVFSTEFTNLNTKKKLESRDKLKNIVVKNGKIIEFNMIYCESGIFTMGSNDSNDNNPKRVVEIESPFWLGETEITQELYQLVMGYNPSRHQDAEAYSIRRPVERVTWYDAIMFCNKLSMLLGKSPYYTMRSIQYEEDTYKYSIKKASLKINEGANGFRLPLSKEWEYAAKASTNNKWSGTNDKSQLKDYAWLYDNSNLRGDRQTVPIAKKNPNEWGFYDMTGNVSEWCWDVPIINKSLRVHRGSSATADMKYSPITHESKASVDTRMNVIGFRVASSLSL